MFFQPIYATNKRRLTRARWPANDDFFALRHVQVNVAQNMKIAIPFIQLTNLNDWLSHRIS